MANKVQNKNQHSASTREAILETAANLFTIKGFAATSMSDLAENLGLSKAAIYHHFESKESILHNLLESTNTDLEDLLSKLEDFPPSKATTRKILQMFAEFVFSHRRVARLVLSEMPDEMKAQGPQSHTCMLRLHRLLAGKKSTAESNIRARVAIGIIASGIVRPTREKSRRDEEVNLELLVSIASDALGITPAKK